MIQWILDRWRGTTFGGVRSPKWSQVRKNFIKLNPTCAVCGRMGNLLKPNEVHHCIPFHMKPELELISSNLITLCRPHHYTFAHYDNWSSWNENVREDTKEWLNRIKNRPVDNHLSISKEVV